MTYVTKEMIGAAHDVMLKKGDFILSADLLEKIYKAMRAREPKDGDAEPCPTCESLARAVLTDQIGTS